jgi:MFS family permease
LTSIGAPGGLVGLSWALGAIVEVPLLIAFPLLARRIGLERLVLIGAGLLFVRALAIAVVGDPVLAALTMILHGGGFALLLVGGVTYVARHAPVSASGTAQGVLSGVLSGVVVGLAQIIGPGIGGLVARQVGLTALFLTAAVVGAIGVVALGFAFGRRPSVGSLGAADSAGELG